MLEGARIRLVTAKLGSGSWQQTLKDCGATILQHVILQPPQCSPAVSRFAHELITGGIDIAIFTTACGVREMIEQVATRIQRQRFVDCLSDIPIIATNAASLELRNAGVTRNLIVTDQIKGIWREILAVFDSRLPVSNRVVGLELTYPTLGLTAGIEARGGTVFPLPVFENPELEKLALLDNPVDFTIIDSASAMAGFVALSNSELSSSDPKTRLDLGQLVVTDRDSQEIAKCHQIPFISIVLGNNNDNDQHLCAQVSKIMSQQDVANTKISGPASSSIDASAPWYNSPFMKAARGEPTDVTPIWMMRQAGRYMEEYREVRAKVGFLELCHDPALCSEVMCTAVKKLGVDAAIIFSDLLPILVPMGCDLEFVKGDGPVIHNPVRTTADIDRIVPLDSLDELDFVLQTVKQTRNDLPADMPLIGFSGAPFTLASYMIEGGSSRNYANTKKLMYTDLGAWTQLMNHLTESISMYLLGQIEAGAQCVQLFDSWAGCLSFEDYRKFALPYVQTIINRIPPGVPVINFATGNPALLPHLADTSAAVIGIDWRTRLNDAWHTVGFDRAVQGNLDPTVLLTNVDEIYRQARTVLNEAGGRPGHIFNLGHGILPQTPVENAIALVDAVHELSQI